MEEKILTFLIVIGFATFIVAAAAMIFYSAKILRILRSKYSAIYDELDRPVIFSRNPVAKSKYTKYFGSRKYLELNDQELNYSYRLCKTLNRVAMMGFIVFFVCFFMLVAQF